MNRPCASQRGLTVPATPDPRAGRGRPVGSQRRPATTRSKALKLPAVGVETMQALAAALGASLLLSWVLQFVTGVCDAYPAIATGLALFNAGLAIATAAAAVQRGYARELAFPLAGVVVLGSCLVLWAQSSYRSSLAGAPGYTVPHQPLSYGPNAKEITLTTADGVNLKATYLGKGAGVGLVLVPGWASERDGFAIASLAQWLAPRFDVLVLDQRGKGGSGGTLTPDLKSKYDFLAAVAYLNAHGASQVGVLAEREAALPALMAAAEQGDIRSLALAAPSGRWGEAPLKASFFRDPSNFFGRLYWRVGAGVRIAGGQGPETAELLTKGSGAPILLLGSKEDPQGLLRQLHLIAPEPRSLRVFAGQGSPVAWSDFQAYYHTLSQWFSLTLAETESRATVLPGAAPEATESVVAP